MEPTSLVSKLLEEHERHEDARFELIETRLKLIHDEVGQLRTWLIGALTTGLAGALATLLSSCQ